MACQAPEQLSLFELETAPCVVAAADPLEEVFRPQTMEEREARRASWCEDHEVHHCGVCALKGTPSRVPRAAEVGTINLRALAREDWDEYCLKRGLALALLARGATPLDVAEETGIRRNTLHTWQWRHRVRTESGQPGLWDDSGSVRDHGGSRQGQETAAREETTEQGG